ncbi:acyltransferase family protein [Galactobacter valiniphilus]|uniref:acyltransferase family protein n=1 Tax=Galactobacter valiniphilus TaxID=2676122 RepID=UPI00373627A1
MPSKRDPKLDLAKAVLICLVVLGHYIEAADGRWNTDLGYGMRAIYMVHMPAFVFLAGVTAKAAGTVSKVVQWLTLLVVFTAIYVGVDAITPRVNRGFELIEPYWILWFLFALALWQALMPLVERFPRTLVVASVAVGAAAGLIPAIGTEFTLSRATVYLPFFVVGAVYGKRFLAAIDRLPGMARAGLVLVAVACALYLGTQGIARHWLYGNRSVDDLNAGLLEGLALRLVLDAMAFVGLAALWAVLPRREGWFTVPGRRSLAIYLLHGIPVTLLSAWLRDVLDLPLGTPLLLAASVGLTCITVAVFSLPFWDTAIRQVGTVISRHVPRGAQGRRKPPTAAR